MTVQLSVNKKEEKRFLIKPLFRHLNPHLLLALVLAIVYHGGLLLSGSYTKTYDAYLHIFFADHYAHAWFDDWEYRWYTGFSMTSYPPGAHQSIALISFLVGLQNAYIIVQLLSILWIICGVYRFSRLWVSEEAAGYAALLAVFSSSIAETVHVYGQLPTTFALGFLLNSLPYLKRWLEEGRWSSLLVGWTVNAAATAGHHVTTLFGMIFFIGPVIVSAIVEKFRQPLLDESPQHTVCFTCQNLKALMLRRLHYILPTTFRSGVYGIGMIIVMVVVVLPYWVWSISNPITQVPIPHPSRDSYIANLNAGLIFWLIPYSLSLLALPYILYRGLSSKAWPLVISFGMLFLLGLGGTTPIPRLILRSVFDILTFDRFTFWATVIVLPLLGEFVVSLRHGGLAKYLQEHFGFFTWHSMQVVLLIAYLLLSICVANFTRFVRIEPDPIDMQPIVHFLDRDQHWRWRYLTLGFGDQMAWLSAQTTATTVDGDYHSARHLPELTSYPVERLDGAKYHGILAIRSLQKFLTAPEKYNLKFVFSNDHFYDPLLYFSGWHRLQQLENGIIVWDRENVTPLPDVLPRKETPLYLRIMWGILPMTTIILACIAMSVPLWWPALGRFFEFLGVGRFVRRLKSVKSEKRKLFRKAGLAICNFTTQVHDRLLR